MPDSTSRLIAGRYRLVRHLGQGGMGQVWAARDELLGRDVAVKEMLAHHGLATADLRDRSERTMREARAIARLTHRNVVRVIDVVTDNGLPCIVMELVPSRSLHEAVYEDGPLPPERVARIGLEVLAGLRAAHREGLLHRDVKPANVLLAHDGRTVLADFGLVSIAGDSSMTDTGIVLGSPSFLAPELAFDREATPACDLWSLGATLYYAVEGTPPYKKSTPAATLASLATELPRRPLRAGALSDVLEGLLRRDPRHRIDAATTERLLRVAAGDEAPPPQSPAPEQTSGRRGRAVILAVAAAALLTAVVLVNPLDLPRDGSGDFRFQRPPAAAPAAVVTPSPTATSAAPSPSKTRPSSAAAPKRRTTTTAAARDGASGEESTAAPRSSTIVSLQAVVNDRYVAADDAGESPIIAFPDAIGPWETWYEVDLGDGEIALRSDVNKKFVIADPAGAEPLIASQDDLGPAETFHLVNNADGTVSLLARANGKYVTAAQNGTAPLINTGDSIGKAEKFRRIEH